MRIKKYDQFQLISEKFGNSKEYSDFLKKYSLGNYYFTDNLMSISDIDGVTIDLCKVIVDKDNKFVSEVTSELFIRYMVSIQYKIPTDDCGVDDFFKRIGVFDEVKLSIEELKDRCSDVSLAWEKVFFEPSDVYSAQEINNFKFNISMHFLSENISGELKSYYDKYKSSIDGGLSGNVK